MVWTVILAVAVVADWKNTQDATLDLALSEARAHLNRDQAFRLWAATYGGFYVPVSENTPPNPYLAHIPERDIETPSGTKLTLMNPAYALRQMNENFAGLFSDLGHITSLNPLRPQNEPDDWEREALLVLDDGAAEVQEQIEIDGEPYLRLMRPIVTEAGCLKCHAQQGYEVGDVSGGTSIAVPIASYKAEADQAIRKHMLTFASIWIVGLGIIGISSKRLEETILDLDRTQIRLTKSHDELERIYDLSIDMICVGDIDGFIRKINPAFGTTLGYSDEELLGAHLLDFVHPDDQAATIVEIEEKLERGIPLINFRHRFRKKDGDYIWVAWTSNPVPELMITHAVGRNITDQVEAERKLKEYSERMGELVEVRTQELCEANERLLRREKLAVLGQLAGGVGHELRHPLAVISNAVYFLKSTQTGADEKTVEYLDILAEEVQNANHIIGDLLDMGRSRPPEPAIVTLSSAMAKVLDRVPPTENITVRWDIPDNELAVYVDEGQIGIVFRNLVENAYQAMLEGGELKLEVAAEKNRVLLRVTDNGTGISEENKTKIFEPLFTTKPRGVGLGLVISKNLVEANGGSIEIENSDEYGTTFLVTLPGAQPREVG
ncbi:MAG: DUF3365 domain-containing protein [Anaerolineales bacterium]|nr:DUF3365 domain-containing protein [Anaerolineales bacterium]